LKIPFAHPSAPTDTFVDAAKTTTFKRKTSLLTAASHKEAKHIDQRTGDCCHSHFFSHTTTTSPQEPHVVSNTTSLFFSLQDYYDLAYVRVSIHLPECLLTQYPESSPYSVTSTNSKNRELISKSYSEHHMPLPTSSS
jgi:hypothetical protein